MSCSSRLRVSAFGAADPAPCGSRGAPVLAVRTSGVTQTESCAPWSQIPAFGADYSICRSLSRVSPRCLLLPSAHRVGCPLHRLPVSLSAASARCVGDAAGISHPRGCLQQEVSLWPFEQSGVWTPGLSLCPKQVEEGRVERALPFLLVLFCPCLSLCPVFPSRNSCDGCRLVS